MKNILITGATGNIGIELIKYLYLLNTENRIIAGVRNIEKARQFFKEYDKLEYVHFDFENPQTFDKSLKNIDSIFLLRPPHISDIETYFKPLISKIKENGINEIVFLSVQGAEKSKVIPHNKIEGLIKKYGIEYVFLRPSYFMQNLTTTLYNDIKNKRKIILPSAKAKFNWIDIENIAETAALVLHQFDKYKNRAIELTGYENLNFYEVVDLINQSVENKIEFKPVNPLKFYNIKKKEGMITGMILVMIMLHFLPRFQKVPIISNFYEKISGKKPTMLKEFIDREKIKFSISNA